MKHDWDKKKKKKRKRKKALTQEKELTSHAGIVWFATRVIGLCLVGNHGHALSYCSSASDS